MHDQCPSGCRGLKSETKTAFINAGISETICIYDNEYYIIEDSGEKHWTCVGAHEDGTDENTICPSNQIFCGNAISSEGLPLYSSLEMQIRLVGIALRENLRRYPYCPGYY
eukprot:UN05071